MQQLANIVTISRIFSAICLLFCPIFSTVFYIVYLFCGITDMADGTIARKTKSVSELGARLDTVADSVFVAVCFVKILPLMQFPAWLWIWIAMYHNLRTLIYDSVSCEPEERLWAKLPSYYVGDSFVRLIPFKDHINLEAQEVIRYKEELAGYKITPKGMLQIGVKQEIPCGVLLQIVKETLES